MKRLLPAVLCLALLGHGAVGAATWVEQMEVRPGGLLVIDLEPGGSIDVSTWDRNLLRVEAEFHGRDEADVRFELAGDADRVEISATYRDASPHRSLSGTVAIRLPQRFDIRLHTSGGEVRIDGVEGRIAGETMGGQLMLSGLCADLDLTTHGGNVRLTRSEVGGAVRTYGGNVHLEEIAGTVDASTLGGNVVYDDVRPGSGRCSDTPGEETKVSTHGGNIRVPLAPYGADLETMGGNISVEQAAEYVKAKTMGGNIVIGAVDGWVKATTMGGTIEVTMVGQASSGRRDVRLTSLGGDVTLTVPGDLSMTVDITLAYTKNSRREFEIFSDFPLDIRRSDDWDRSSGTARKYLYGTAPGGEHKVKIETVNGNVRLIKDN
jgi:hypothetical protein